MNAQYNRTQMAEALRLAGLKQGDIVFSHSNVGYFGFPEEGKTADIIFQTVLDAFRDVLGEEGTLVVPTFTYSYCKGQPFDPDNTPSTCGMFTEMLRQYPGVYRSQDPIFSVTALGKQARELTADVPTECFGRGSFWDRFLQADGVICNLNFDAGSTFIHFVERCLNVPYRYDKLFTGIFTRLGQSRKGAAIYFCQDMSNPDTVAKFEPFDALARKNGLVRSVAVGRGALICIKASDTYNVIEQGLKTDRWLLTASAKSGKNPVLIKPADTARFGVSLPENTSMEQILEALWRLPRDIISDGYDAALEALTAQIPMKVHEYPTGTHCWTWIIPEKWTCHKASLETIDGRQLFSYADNPLHVVSYSLPFTGEVSRIELFDHLYTHSGIADAIPFKFKYYDRDWGLCCSQDLKNSMTDDRYKVEIDTSFSYSTLKVGEVVVPGKSEECIVLCAHLCHPAMANDGLTGVIVGVEVMRELLRRRDLRYTYRLLILPETIGSIAYLSQAEGLIPKLKGGLFLEMLGMEYPHSLQLSFAGNTELDLCFTMAMKESDPSSWTGAFRTVIGNDERQFNSPGVRIPMLSLSRVLPSSEPGSPYPQYHSSHDTPELISGKRLEDSRDLILRMIDMLENNVIPVNRFKGEVFCSRYGIHIDYYTDPEANRNLFNIMYLIDGTMSVAEIAGKCKISFAAVKKVIDELYVHGLVEYQYQVNRHLG
jgi:aminopeptidase-like protein/aminoglycoside N3'-acetyltransferase